MASKSTMQFTKCKDKATQNKKINAYYNSTKGGADSNDKKFSLFTTARNTNHWPTRICNRILDSSLVNAYAILIMNNPSLGEYA